MTNDELLKAHMDQLAKDQQNYRDDMSTIQARMDAQQTRTDERMKAMQARMDAQQTRTDERMEAMQIHSNEQMAAIKRDIRANIWSAFGVGVAVIGLILANLH